jgi:hypothetical protein
LAKEKEKKSKKDNYSYEQQEVYLSQSFQLRRSRESDNLRKILSVNSISELSESVEKIAIFNHLQQKIHKPESEP